MSDRHSKPSPIPTRPASPRSRQRGAAAIVIAGVLISVVSLMALSIDLGQLYYAQRDLQTLATLAALDASRVESGCYPGGSGAQGSLEAAKATVMNTVTANSKATIAETVEFGRYDDSTVPDKRIFTALDETSSQVNAVRVTLRRSQPPLLVPFIGDVVAPAGTLVATASAQHAPVASFRLGTSVVTLSQQSALNTLLSALLGSNVNLSLLSYQSLATANVTLLQLQTALGIGNAGDLLTTQLPLGTILNGIATALGNSGQALAAGALTQLAALADPSLKTTLGQALGIETGAEKLVGALPLNTVALLNGLAMSARNGLYPIQLKPVLNIANLVSLQAFIQVGAVPAAPSQSDDLVGAGRPGRTAGGVPHTKALQQQVTLQLRLVVNNVPGLAALAQVKLGVDIGVGQAASELRSILCPSTGASPRLQPVVNLDTTLDTAKVSIGSFDSLDPTKPVKAGSLLNVAFGLIAINLSTPISTTVGATGPVTSTFTGPFPSEPQTIGTAVSLSQTVNDLSGSLKNNLSICVTPLICLPVGGLASAVLGILTPVTAVLDQLVTPLLQALGLQLGSATVMVDSVDYGNAGRKASTSSTPFLFNQQKPGEAGGGTR